MWHHILTSSYFRFCPFHKFQIENKIVKNLFPSMVAKRRHRIFQNSVIWRIMTQSQRKFSKFNANSQSWKHQNKNLLFERVILMTLSKKGFWAKGFLLFLSEKISSPYLFSLTRNFFSRVNTKVKKQLSRWEQDETLFHVVHRVVIMTDAMVSSVNLFCFNVVHDNDSVYDVR